MPFTVKKREVTFGYRDISGRTRSRDVEMGLLNLIMDDDATDLDMVSKSALVSYWEKAKQVDLSNVPEADSEVGDTLRLQFLMEDNTKYHFDIVDPKDNLFIATDGAGKNIAISYAALDGAVAEQQALKDIIDRVLSGDSLISDGERPHSYLKGYRL